MKNNMIGWVEIPVSDMDRAKKFYDTVFQIDIQVHNMGPLVMGWFPFAEDKPGSTGSLVLHKDWYKPSDSHGPLVYFSSADVQQELDRVERAGGKIINPKTLIKDDVGYMAVFRDTEGNRIALHSRK
ncbi:VOC family protein [Zeaxanthinibacter enoshimensis]|uniref:VOC family protein n=1 Tax=Zeaxanthinibacter enoshimensis TaxID=392009 RepID=UPI00356AB106